MNADEFSKLVDQTGLNLTDHQKSVLYGAWPMFQSMVARATPAMPREAEPSVMFTSEV